MAVAPGGPQTGNTHTQCHTHTHTHTHSNKGPKKKKERGHMDALWCVPRVNWAPCEPHGCLVVLSACECVCVMRESVCLPASVGAADAGPWSWFDVTPSPSPSPPVVTSLSPSPSRAVSSTPSSVAGTTTMSRSPLPTNGAGVTVSLATGLQLNYLSTVTAVTFRATYTGGTWYVWAALVVHLRVELCGPVDRGWRCSKRAPGMCIAAALCTLLLWL